VALSVAVLGTGAVGARTVRQLASSAEVGRVTVADAEADRAAGVAAAIADRKRVRASRPGQDWWAGADVGILAMAPGEHRAAAERLLESGVSVVSVSDAVSDVEALLDLDAEARERGLSVVVGAAFAPGLSCVLASHAAAGFDAVDEIHIARVGTGGRACARQRHAALAREAVEWREGAWARHPSGTGRQLCWFPDPIGAEDCYRAAAPDALLLMPAFEGVRRVTSRVAANRRDRLTARLPMMRPPHVEGGPGAIRVEVRGRRGGATDVVVLGAMDRPAVAAGAVAALTAIGVGHGELHAPGASGLAARVSPVPFLAELSRRGVKAAVFDGHPE
jgi:hypothetical protein